ncbi:hypothetical protein M5849_004206 [Salmonella enterica]|nr:hypothetical protein [Salmonella enterica]
MILKPMGTPGKCPAHLRPWTAEEDKLLVNLYPHKYGDFHHCTKYQDSDVELTRQLRDEYNLKFREIGEKFDISAYYCQRLYHRRHTAIDAIAREYLPR